MNFAISWVLGLFKKPQVEVTFKPEAAAWPFPVPKEDKDFFGLDRPVKKPRVKKTRPLPSKATIAKAAAKKSIAAKKAKK